MPSFQSGRYVRHTTSFALAVTLAFAVALSVAITFVVAFALAVTLAFAVTRVISFAFDWNNTNTFANGFTEIMYKPRRNN